MFHSYAVSVGIGPSLLECGHSIHSSVSFIGCMGVCISGKIGDRVSSTELG